MSIEHDSSTQGRPSGVRLFAAMLVIVVCAAIVLTLVIRQSTPPAPVTGKKAPEIRVAGWYNGPGPTAEDLRGKVIVLDAWAFWCVPCRVKAPELVKLHEHYRERGVVFIGLTGEGAQAESKSRGFLKATNIGWPNGYGAVQTLLDLNNEYIPQTWVIDRKYNLIWDESRATEPIEAAIDRALAEAP